MKNKFDDFNKKSMIFKSFIIVLSLLFNLIIFLESEDEIILLTTLGFSLIIIVLFFIYDKTFENYMMSILEKLSDMLSTISDMRDEAVFPLVDDSIFAKLQHQTMKLTKILKSQNLKMEQDKNEVKSLISDIAHQLKTPLTNMKMYSELLKDDDLSEEERDEFNKVILISLDKLCFLVESMIKMSRLESSVINIKPTYENLNETIILAITQLYKKAKLKNIKINFNQKDKVYLYHDKKWTCEALFNIIENAIKYSKENTIVDISIEKYEMFTRIDIKDEGITIDEDEIWKIFLRFYRGKKVLQEEGIGIGLYLSREIITKQNGYIKVTSTPQYTIFSVFLQNDNLKIDKN